MSATREQVCFILSVGHDNDRLACWSRAALAIGLRRHVLPIGHVLPPKTSGCRTRALTTSA
eukprot:3068535-Rhodomonas_salina.1